MPIDSSKFSSNSLTGTVRVVNGFANISLPTAFYALEGNVTFTVQVRTDSVSGAVIYSSPNVTLRDTSSFVSLTANTATVNEGDLVAFTLVTANALGNSTLYYSVFPVTANVTSSDFVANTGSFSLTNNAGIFTLKANADLSLMNETGENFRVQLRTVSPVGNVVYTTSNITIQDTSNAYNVLSFVAGSASPIAEGSNVTFTFIGTNIPNGTVLYYNTTGNLTSFSSNTGSFVMNSTSNTFVISNPQVPTNASRVYNVVVRDASAQGPIIATSNTINVLDGALTYIAATGGTISDYNGYRIHLFETSSNLIITNSGAGGAFSQLEYILEAGYGGNGGYLYDSGGGGGGGVLRGNVVINSTGPIAVVVGAGGAGGNKTNWVSYGDNGANGSNSRITAPFIAYDIYALGGGGGGGGQNTPPTNGGGYYVGQDGGSGGGSKLWLAGAGIKPSILNALSYGNPGSNFYYYGGGAGSAGSPSNLGAGLAFPEFDNSGVAYGGPGGNGNGGQGNAGRKGNVKIKYLYVAGASYTSLTSNVSANTYMGENEEIYFTLNTLNLSNNTLLYYTTVGNVISSDFVSGNTGSFRSRGNSTIFVLRSNTNIPTNQERYFQIQVNPDGIGEAAAITSNVYTIRDDALMPLPVGQIEYTTAGTYSFTVPNRVSNVSVVAVGGGAAGDYSIGGGGGALAYVNNIPVTPGNVYTVIVGASGTYGGNPTWIGGNSSFSSFVVAGGGGINGTIGGHPGGIGPAGGTVITGTGGAGGAGGNSGGGGAGGYGGAGGNGANGPIAAQNGSGGGGGGGASKHPSGGDGKRGGGVGIYGQGANGTGAPAGEGSSPSPAFSASPTVWGGGGSGGENGGPMAEYGGLYIGRFGAGGGGSGNPGGPGAVRIIWGSGRYFPNVLTTNM